MLVNVSECSRNRYRVCHETAAFVSYGLLRSGLTKEIIMKRIPRLMLAVAVVTAGVSALPMQVQARDRDERGYDRSYSEDRNHHHHDHDRGNWVAPLIGGLALGAIGLGACSAYCGSTYVAPPPVYYTPPVRNYYYAPPVQQYYVPQTDYYTPQVQQYYTPPQVYYSRPPVVYSPYNYPVYGRGW